MKKILLVFLFFLLIGNVFAQEAIISPLFNEQVDWPYLKITDPFGDGFNLNLEQQNQYFYLPIYNDTKKDKIELYKINVNTNISLENISPNTTYNLEYIIENSWKTDAPPTLKKIEFDYHKKGNYYKGYFKIIPKQNNEIIGLNCNGMYKLIRNENYDFQGCDLWVKEKKGDTIINHKYKILVSFIKEFLVEKQKRYYLLHKTKVVYKETNETEYYINQTQIIPKEDIINLKNNTLNNQNQIINKKIIEIISQDGTFNKEISYSRKTLCKENGKWIPKKAKYKLKLNFYPYNSQNNQRYIILEGSLIPENNNCLKYFFVYPKEKINDNVNVLFTYNNQSILQIKTSKNKGYDIYEIYDKFAMDPLIKETYFDNVNYKLILENHSNSITEQFSQQWKYIKLPKNSKEYANNLTIKLIGNNYYINYVYEINNEKYLINQKINNIYTPNTYKFVAYDPYDLDNVKKTIYLITDYVGKDKEGNDYITIKIYDPAYTTPQFTFNEDKPDFLNTYYLKTKDTYFTLEKYKQITINHLELGNYMEGKFIDIKYKRENSDTEFYLNYTINNKTGKIEIHNFAIIGKESYKYNGNVLKDKDIYYFTSQNRSGEKGDNFAIKINYEKNNIQLTLYDKKAEKNTTINAVNLHFEITLEECELSNFNSKHKILTYLDKKINFKVKRYLYTINGELEQQTVSYNGNKSHIDFGITNINFIHYSLKLPEKDGIYYYCDKTYNTTQIEVSKHGDILIINDPLLLESKEIIPKKDIHTLEDKEGKVQENINPTYKISGFENKTEDIIEVKYNRKAKKYDDITKSYVDDGKKEYSLTIPYELDKTSNKLTLDGIILSNTENVKYINSNKKIFIPTRNNNLKRTIVYSDKYTNENFYLNINYNKSLNKWIIEWYDTESDEHKEITIGLDETIKIIMAKKETNVSINYNRKDGTKVKTKLKIIPEKEKIEIKTNKESKELTQNKKENIKLTENVNATIEFNKDKENIIIKIKDKESDEHKVINVKNQEITSNSSIWKVILKLILDKIKK